MSDKTRWDARLTDEQRRAALDRVTELLNLVVPCSDMDDSAASRLRAAFAAKPRERVGWIDARTFNGVSGFCLGNDKVSEYAIRVRVTEILGDDSEPQP